MTTATDNLVLEHLRAIRAEIASLRTDTKDIKARMTALEIAVAGFASSEMSHYASLTTRADRADERLDRIERQLEIVDGGCDALTSFEPVRQGRDAAESSASRYRSFTTRN